MKIFKKIRHSYHAIQLVECTMKLENVLQNVLLCTAILKKIECPPCTVCSLKFLLKSGTMVFSMKTLSQRWND